MKVTIYEILCKSDLIAAGFLLPEEDILEIFQDARMLTKLNERWSAYLYSYEEVGADCKGHDLVCGDKRISVKSITNSGSNVSDSSFQGAGRSGTYQEIRTCFMKNDEIIIVDNRQFPLMRFCRLTTKQVMEWIDSGKWTTNKINPKRTGRKSNNQPMFKISAERWDLLLSELETEYLRVDFKFEDKNIKMTSTEWKNPKASTLTQFFK